MRRPLACCAVAASALAAVAPGASAQGPKFLNKQYSDTVHDLRACLAVLAPQERRLVVLRSGIGPNDPLSGPQVAAQLHIPAATVSHAQWAAVRKMKVAQQAGRCSGAKPAASKPATPARPVARTASVSDKPGWGDPKVLALLAFAGLCLLGVLRELLGAIRA